MKRIGLVVKHDARAIQTADGLEGWLERQGVGVFRQALPAAGPAASGKIGPHAPPSDLSCVLVLGGDGTFLSAVRWMGNPPLPTLGIKFGEVGFLAEIAEENLFEAVSGILKGNYTTAPRMRLEVTVRRGGRETARETILNDLVVNKGALARLASIRTHLDGQYLTTYKADGLIVATPTGSTAYSLAAGGPVIHPEVAGIILTPICPFTLTVRPLVVPETATIEIGLEKKTPDIMLTFDGQAGMAIEEGDIITIRRSPHPLNLIHLPGQPYYEVLKAKLHWSGGRI